MCCYWSRTFSNLENFSLMFFTKKFWGDCKISWCSVNLFIIDALVTFIAFSFHVLLIILATVKVFNSMPPSLCDKQVVGPSALSVIVAQCDKRHDNRA